MRILRILWPVAPGEWKRFLSLFAIGFLICLNYSILRILKDTLVITEGTSGAAILPFLKTWGVLPAALCMAPLLSWLLRRFQRVQVVTGIMGSFILFWVLFDLLYPYRGDHAWPLFAFYIVAELWKTTTLMVLFWGYVNGTTPLEQAKRLYGPLVISGSLAGIASGGLTQWAMTLGSFGQSLNLLLGFVIASGVITLFWLRRFHKVQPFESHQPSPKHVALESSTPLPAEEQPQSFWQTLRIVFSNRILACLAIMIFADYIAFHIVEVLWKEQVFQLYPNSQDFAQFTGRVALWSGVCALLSTFFLSGPLIRSWGWTVVALITPLTLLATSLGFFAFSFWVSAPLAVPVLFGALHSILSRSARDAFGTTTKELAYIPLSPILQTHGKALVDGVCPPIGKSTSALIQQGLLLSFPSLLATGPYSAVIVVGVLALAISSGALAGAQITRSAQPA